MELKELKEKVYNCVEGGNTLVIEFYKGTQREDVEGTSYDDDNWFLAEREGYSDNLLFQCYGDYEEQVLMMFLKKKGVL